MPPVLPLSLSPHICVLCSADLELLLRSSSLPPLAQLLQYFSPLSQVTTRTTALTSVSHSSFNLRFSDLVEIEEACKEDEEERANRTIDWMSTRISQRSGQWVEIMDKSQSEGFTTPWWEELKKCSEGDHAPSKDEYWNHPVAVICAVSTTAANPLQALQDLHSRPADFPYWVDSAHLRCSLIVHPESSSLSDPITDSLFNAIKKQHGLHSYLLRLSLPDPPPAVVPVATPLPRLPSTHSPASNGSSPQLVTKQLEKLEGYGLRMTEVDLHSTARLVREFAVMSLIPWMEKCVLDWNDNYASSRRLPSLFFSSTRRLFGSGSITSSATTPSTTPYPQSAHAHTGSSSSIQSGSTVAPPAQQRRLAEFATILGDLKLAITMWESVRKEGRGGSETLPLLLNPTPAVSLHVSHAIKTILSTPRPPAYAQLRALSYSVRWDMGIDKKDLLSVALEGDQWLVWAAGSADEPPAAILLAQAAQLSLRRGFRRRAALWYLLAANRLEKYGIKPLTTYFLRRAHNLYLVPPGKDLSPSFWESEEKDPTDWQGFEAIVPGLEHTLGRLRYTTGDTEGAVRLFLGLLTGSSYVSPASSALINGDATVESKENTDKVFLDDFRVAFKHFLDTSGKEVDAADFKLPATFCLANWTKVRLQSDSYGGDFDDWTRREDDWRTFWKTRGKETLDNKRRAVVNETLWVDFVLRNPLNADVELSGLTVIVREAGNDNLDSTGEFLDVEVIEQIVLRARETRTVPIQVRALRPSTLIFAQLSYRFLSLLPCTESLATRGRRLNDTLIQRQSKMYADDVYVQVETVDCGQRLHVNFEDEELLSLAHGERRLFNLWISNTGVQDIEDLWLVAGPDDELWIDLRGESSPTFSKEHSLEAEILHSNNSVACQEPFHIPLEHFSGSSFLTPGFKFELPIIFHVDRVLDQNLCLLFVYRRAGANFNSIRVMRSYKIIPMFNISMVSAPSHRDSHSFVVNLEVQNTTTSADIRISQLTTISPIWACASLADYALDELAPQQLASASLGISRWHDGVEGTQSTRAFVRHKLGDILQGQDLDLSPPPSLDLLCKHFAGKGPVRSIQNPKLSHFIHSGKRNLVHSSLTDTHPNIPATSYPYLFPLYNPSSLDVVLFWEIDSQRRSGHVLVSGLKPGVGHSDLQGVINEAENAKVKRSLFAETEHEKMLILEAIRNSEWNVNSNPIVVSLDDCAVVRHDFSTGPCCTPVTFVLTNCSLTHSSRFTFRLGSDTGVYPPSSGILPPQYSGRRTFRGLLEPSQTAQVQTKIWVSQPGTYSLDGWSLESEVEDLDNRRKEGWQAGHTYRQRSSQGGALSCIIVVAV